MRLFLDANILFSAAYRDASSASRLFDLHELGLCQLTTSRYAFDEAHRNIVAKCADRTSTLVGFARKVEIVREPTPAEILTARGHGVPDKDAPILASALASKAQVLIAGDRKHFGHLYDRSVDGLTVSTLTHALTLTLEQAK